MSYTDLLIDTCTIQDNTPGAQNEYGWPAPAWANVAGQVDIDCRLMDGKGKEIKIGAEVVIAQYKLFLGDITITEQERVVIGSTTYEILLVQDKQNSVGSHHKEVYLRTVR